jgi:hypothetical protein
MHKIGLFAAAVAVFVVIGIDAWLCIRTIIPGALADSTFNHLITPAGAMGPSIPDADDYLLPSHRQQN